MTISALPSVEVEQVYGIRETWTEDPSLRAESHIVDKHHKHLVAFAILPIFWGHFALAEATYRWTDENGNGLRNLRDARGLSEANNLPGPRRLYDITSGELTRQQSLR